MVKALDFSVERLLFFHVDAVFWSVTIFAPIHFNIHRNEWAFVAKKHALIVHILVIYTSDKQRYPYYSKTYVYAIILFFYHSLMTPDLKKQSIEFK